MVRRATKVISVRAISPEDVIQFRAWEEELARRGALAEAQRLSEEMSDALIADVEECWRQIWNKPLYANTRVAIGERYEQKLSSIMPGAWRFVGLDPERFLITHQGTGSSAENFTEFGSIIQQIRKVSGVAAKRLYAIQGGAAFLRELVSENGESAPLSPYASGNFDEVLAKLHNVVGDFRKRLGRGWGHITVMHMLTDFGLSVKPDIHLVRAVRRLGLVEGLRDASIPNEREAMVIVTAIAHLVQAVYGDEASFAKLRYTDKMLMDASRAGLL